METKVYDVLIVGGGVAGMSAAVYAKRRGKKVAIVEKMMLGGQVNSIEKIENFPSQAMIDGFSLSQMFAGQIKALNVEVIYDDVLEMGFVGEEKSVVGKKESYLAKSIIIASGLSYVELGKNENQFLGRGVSYCAVCDANFFKGKPVCVVSKKGSGLKAALELAGVCSSVTVLDSEDMSVFASANKNQKIEVLSNVKINKLVGEGSVQAVQFEKDGKAQELATSALFVELGKKPNRALFEGLNVDKDGFILTNEKMETSISGVYAVGDVRSKNLKQIVTACSDGAIAGTNV